MKNICKFILAIFLLAVLTFGCGAGARKGNLSADADKRTRAETKFDPMGGRGDDDIITSNVPPAKEPNNAGDLQSLPQKTEPSKDADDFFSVQLFASKSSSEAKAYMNSIASRFNEDVRIDYQAPYYRVCTGSAIGFDEGERLLQSVTAKGFPNAWLVRVRK